MKDILAYIIPDVHGRNFWMDVMETDESVPIYFLGDYLDPYPAEGIMKQDAIDIFAEILDFASHRDNVHLLLGNHDCGYCSSDYVCDCRMDFRNNEVIRGMFESNWSKFKYVETIKYGGILYVMSHAGLNPKWIEAHSDIFGVPETDGMETVCSNVNLMLLRNDDNAVKILGEYSKYRGMFGLPYGSVVWNDVKDMLSIEGRTCPEGCMQIFGHKISNEPIFHKNEFAMIDCLKCFCLHFDGTISKLE